MDMEEYFRQSAKNERTAEEVIPFQDQIDEYTLRTRGRYVRTWHIGGVPSHCASNQERNDWYTTLHQLMCRLAASGMPIEIYDHRIRTKIDTVEQRNFNDPFSGSINRGYEAKLEKEGFYETEQYLSIAYVATPDSFGSTAAMVLRVIGDLFWRRRSKKEAGVLGQIAPSMAQERERETIILEKLEALSRQFESGMSPFRPTRLGVYRANGVVFSALKEFHAQTINGYWQRFPFISHEAFARAALTVRTYFGREAGKLRGKTDAQTNFVRVLGMKDFPNQTYWGLLDSTRTREWTGTLFQSFRPYKRNLGIKRLKTVAKNMRQTDDESRKQANQIDGGQNSAIDRAGSDELVLGQYRFGLIVSGKTPEERERHIANVDTPLSNAGVVLASDVPEALYFSGLVGNGIFAPRRFDITSENWTGFVAPNSFPRGRKTGNYWGNYLALLRRSDKGPFYLNLHLAGKGEPPGHTLLAGRTGGGKTVAQNWLLTQLRLFDAAIIGFDHGRGMYPLVTAMGGQYNELRIGESTGWAPLQQEPTPRNIEQVQVLVRTLANMDQQILSTDQEIVLSNAVKYVFAMENVFERKLSAVLQFLDGPEGLEVRRRLEKWVGTGRLAWLFDNDRDTLVLSKNITAFNMTDFLSSDEVRIPAMMYLFHRQHELIDGSRRVVIAIDEFQRMLRDVHFTTNVKDWLETMRKRNCIVMVATAAPHEILASPVGKTFVTNTVSQFFFPSPGAKKEDYCNGFGLTAREYDRVFKLDKGRQQFMFKQDGSSVILELPLGDLRELPILAGSPKTSTLLERVIAEVGNNPRDFLPKFYAETANG